MWKYLLDSLFQYSKGLKVPSAVWITLDLVSHGRSRSRRGLFHRARYTMARKTFGSPIASYQIPQLKFAKYAHWIGSGIWDVLSSQSDEGRRPPCIRLQFNNQKKFVCKSLCKSREMQERSTRRNTGLWMTISHHSPRNESWKLSIHMKELQIFTPWF